jgi:hypothetical protein
VSWVLEKYDGSEPPTSDHLHYSVVYKQLDGSELPPILIWRFPGVPQHIQIQLYLYKRVLGVSEYSSAFQKMKLIHFGSIGAAFCFGNSENLLIWLVCTNWYFCINKASTSI